MKRVVVIDYGMGNLDSVRRGIEECGGDVQVSDQPAALHEADAIILPGVGSFTDGMRHLRERGWIDVMNEQVQEKQIPFLGICLGMQLMASKGYEGGETPGLNWIPGEVKRFIPQQASERVPHIGWNEVHPVRQTPLLQDIEPGRDFYFVHSYNVHCENRDDVVAETPYCGKFVSVIGRDNFFGVQFHPEKSQKFGLQILKNFLSL